jgi:sialic acid synthase SpsE
MKKNTVHIIAEMACSHEGDVQLGKKIIDGAGEARADAIQFQVWQAKDIIVPHHPEYEKVSNIEIAHQGWRELADYTRDRYPDMQIIACVYEPGSVDVCEDMHVDAYKIHSSDISNPYLTKYVAKTGKRIDLSVGATTIDEIQAAIEHIRQTSGSDIWLMYGYQNFPTPTDAIHMDYMMALKSLFNLPIGYQDHSDADTDAAFWLPAAAVGMGVEIIEKHITHDRAFKGIDHEAALNPDEFARLVYMIREIEAAKGTSVPRPFSDEELKYRKYAKKSLVAARALPAGTVITEDDVLFLRAVDLGLPPDQAHRIIGKTAGKEIAAFHLIREEDVR